MATTLSTLSVQEGAKTKRFIKGRGRGTGNGKTAGKGTKGQGAHNHTKKGGFEGGDRTGKRLWDGKVVTMGGMIEGKKNLITKNNKMMAFVDLEDLEGVTEVIVFPNVYDRCRDVLFEDSVIAVRGKLNFKEGEVPKLLADNIVPLEEAEDVTRAEGRRDGAKRPAQDFVSPEPSAPRQKAHAPTGPMVKIRIPAGIDETEALYTLEGMFRVNLGETPVLVYLQDGKIVRSNTQVKVSESLLGRLTELAGEDNVKVTGVEA